MLSTENSEKEDDCEGRGLAGQQEQREREIQTHTTQDKKKRALIKPLTISAPGTGRNNTTLPRGT